jgi:hypothetical protein
MVIVGFAPECVQRGLHEGAQREGEPSTRGFVNIRRRLEDLRPVPPPLLDSGGRLSGKGAGAGK